MRHKSKLYIELLLNYVITKISKHREQLTNPIILNKPGIEKLFIK